MAKQKKLPIRVSDYTEIPSNWARVEDLLKRKLTTEEKDKIVKSYNELKNGAYDWDVIDWNWNKI